MASSLTEEQVSFYREGFNISSGGDETLASSSLGETLRALGLNPSEAQVAASLAGLELDDSGKLSFEEFLNIVKECRIPVESQEDDLKAIFRLVDRTGSGEIALKDLSKILLQKGEVLSEELMETILGRANITDGTLTYEEFRAIFTFEW
eukprot:TRINITY_DN2352_c1_g1_i1.p1 TRINITY_DN2352_c1_g1~~TRINITY_DN2352_c1_g1_i1.p1  ORF type:complete len:150 (-),score=33.86 TRINITY_DN2352_c1_g1_i1:160-609(-)